MIVPISPRNLGAIPGFFRFHQDGSTTEGGATDGGATEICPCENWNCREVETPETLFLERTRQRSDDIPVTVIVKRLVCGTTAQPKLPCEEELAALRLHYGLL